MLNLYTAKNLAEASLLKGLLANAGIEVHIFNHYSLGAMGELPPDQVQPQLWLEKPEHEATAKMIILQYEKNISRYRDTFFCRRCHEANPATFEVCWHCGEEL